MLEAIADRLRQHGYNVHAEFQGTKLTAQCFIPLTDEDGIPHEMHVEQIDFAEPGVDPIAVMLVHLPAEDMFDGCGDLTISRRVYSAGRPPAWEREPMRR